MSAENLVRFPNTPILSDAVLLRCGPMNKNPIAFATREEYARERGLAPPP